MEAHRIIYTLCFIQKNESLLMLYRHRPPNAHQWNGVGGKIEAGETPRVAMEREIMEETGLAVENLTYRGLVTWNEEGGMHVYVANTAADHVTQTDEGVLAWKSIDWVLHSDQVVSNIPLFLPAMLDSKLDPCTHAFFYDQEELVGYQVAELPAEWGSEG